VVLANLRRVYGETLSDDDIVDLAQAHYGHLWKLAGEFLRFRWLSRDASWRSCASRISTRSPTPICRARACCC
jgi:hypothetical protein